MRLRTLVVVGAAASAVGLVVWRRRSAAPPPVQLGFADGSLTMLERGDVALAELESLAAGLARQLEAG